MKAGCVAALLLWAKAGMAQNEPAAPTARALAPAEKIAAVAPKVSYAGGQLKIEASGSTLADVLAQVAVLTGVTIDVPAGANSERMPVVELGPGPPRQILASLLSDSNFDYLIQASEADPERIQNVLVMPREKKGDAGRAARGPVVAVAAPPEAPAAESPVPPPPEAAALDANPSNPAPAGMQGDSSAAPTAPNQSGQFSLLQPDGSNPAKPGALAPPATLSPDSINQQLQQMYQQRMQMTQQDHSTGTQPVLLPGSVNK
jgi:hypothetical protein